MLDENEFLSPYGIRSVSRAITKHPYMLHVDGTEYTRRLRARPNPPPDSSAATPTGADPIWFPVNYLLIESLQRFHHYLGRRFQGGVPHRLRHSHESLGSGRRDFATPDAHFPARTKTAAGPSTAKNELYQPDPHWRDLVLFYEYFHGDNGSGLGASHQTGWTGLVAKLMQQSGE